MDALDYPSNLGQKLLGAEIPNFLKDGNSLPGTLPLFPNWIDERK